MLTEDIPESPGDDYHHHPILVIDGTHIPMATIVGRTAYWSIMSDESDLTSLSIGHAW